MQKSAWIIIVCSKQSNEHDKGHPPKQIVEILIKHTYTFFYICLLLHIAMQGSPTCFILFIVSDGDVPAYQTFLLDLD